MEKYMSREQNNSFDAVNKKRRPEFDKKQKSLVTGPVNFICINCLNINATIYCLLRCV